MTLSGRERDVSDFEGERTIRPLKEEKKEEEGRDEKKIGG